MPHLHDRAQDELLLVLEKVKLQLLSDEPRIAPADPIYSAAVYITRHIEDRFGVPMDIDEVQSTLSARQRLGKTVVTGTVDVAGVQLDVSCLLSRHSVKVRCIVKGRRVENAGELAGIAVGEHTPPTR